MLFRSSSGNETEQQFLFSPFLGLFQPILAWNETTMVFFDFFLTSMKHMLAYSSIGQIRYAIIGIIVGDSNGGYASMITYMLFYISTNLGTFACIMLFGLRTRKENIRDYAELYTKDPFLALSFALCFLSLGGLPPLAGFFGKFHLFWCGW